MKIVIFPDSVINFNLYSWKVFHILPTSEQWNFVLAPVFQFLRRLILSCLIFRLYNNFNKCKNFCSFILHSSHLGKSFLLRKWMIIPDVRSTSYWFHLELPRILWWLEQFCQRTLERRVWRGLVDQRTNDCGWEN